MTPRERVLAAATHRVPDRTPRDFWAEEPAWNRLLDHLGLADREAVLERLGIDVRHLNAQVPPDRELARGVYQNFWGERFVHQATPWGPMREDLPGALSGARTFAELQAFAWPANDDFDYSRLAAEVETHRPFALVYGFADIWQRPALVRGWEEFFVDMAQRPAWAHFLCRRFADFYLEDYARAARATGGRLDFYLLISDLGTQRGPLISLPMFREFVAPYLRDLVDCIHAQGARVLFHSCGSIRAFIPELIRLGVDVLDPIQPAGPDMTPEALQSAFGGQVCFHGGIDMQHLLPHGTTAAIQAEVRRYTETLGRTGGYILGPAHLFQPDVPPENVLAVYDGIG